ncbi:MAG: dihydrolipoamide acetyltransferase family protein [Myxococcota bacterium]
MAEVETDKAAMEVEVFDPGYLLKILVPADVEAKVDQPIAIIGPRPDSDISGLVRKFEQGSAGGAPSASPTPAPTATAPTPTPTASAPAANAPAPAAQPARTVAPAPGQSGLEHYTWQGADLNPALMEIPTSFFMPVARKRAAPAARQAAARLNVDLSLVDGTGPHGRVMTEDVKRFAENRNRPAPAARPALPAAPTAAEPEVIPHNNMRKTIARRMKQVYLDAPTFFLTVVFDCDNLVRFRGQMKAAGVKVSYNDILVKAVGRALQDVPAVNASWGDDAITRHGEINIGIAVALDGGLIVPVIRDVDRKGLAQISAETREMAGRARELKLKPHEYQGSTFTISNLGMMGIEHFTAIINQPNSAILAVGGLQQEPVVVDGALSVGWRMRVTMTCDHRVIDGALGAAFLKAVRRYIENPALLAA